jgi:hypothetical protein
LNKSNILREPVKNQGFRGSLVLKNAPGIHKEVYMKNMINWLGPQSRGLCVVAFAAVIVFSLAGCGDVAGGRNYFEFDSASGTITGYDNNGPKNVTLPSSIGGINVTAVGKNAFRDKQLTGVSILTSITTIGEGAFADNKITSLTMLDSVTTIGINAFANNRLTDVIIPNSVISIRERAFANNLLTGVTIGSSVNIIGVRAFFGNQLSSVVIPGNVDYIESDAFTGNPLLSITIGVDKSYAANIVPDFGPVYVNTYGKQAGTYTRPETSSNAWTK